MGLFSRVRERIFLFVKIPGTVVLPGGAQVAVAGGHGLGQVNGPEIDVTRGTQYAPAAGNSNGAFTGALEAVAPFTSMFGFDPLQASGHFSDLSDLTDYRQM